MVKIRAAHGVNGAPRIMANLREAGEVVSTKTIAALMRPSRSAASALARGTRLRRSPPRRSTTFLIWSSVASIRVG